jgi:hypothetical protein
MSAAASRPGCAGAFCETVTGGPPRGRTCCRQDMRCAAPGCAGAFCKAVIRRVPRPRASNPFSGGREAYSDDGICHGGCLDAGAAGRSHFSPLRHGRSSWPSGKRRGRKFPHASFVLGLNIAGKNSSPILRTSTRSAARSMRAAPAAPGRPLRPGAALRAVGRAVRKDCGAQHSRPAVSAAGREMGQSSPASWNE